MARQTVRRKHSYAVVALTQRRCAEPAVCMRLLLTLSQKLSGLGDTAAVDVYCVLPICCPSAVNNQQMEQDVVSVSWSVLWFVALCAAAGVPCLMSQRSVHAGVHVCVHVV
jgi:hypothetical protein